MKAQKVSKLKVTLNQDEIISAIKDYLTNECVFDSEFDDEIQNGTDSQFTFHLTPQGEVAVVFEFNAETEEG